MRYKTKIACNLFFCVLILVTISSFQSCRKKYTPKPYGYYRIDFPEKEYVNLNKNFPYSFEYSKIANIKSDPNNTGEEYWINIEYPGYNGVVYISYKKIKNNLNNYFDDSRKLAYKHTIKADAINELQFINEEKRVFGIVYKIKGNAASSVQFAATDSINHFLRGALYFHTNPNVDSLAPVIKYVEQDIYHLMETLEWE